MNQIPAKIKRRMQALQAMAADTSSENEAMIAARKLHALMIEYNVSELSIGGGEPTIERDSFQMGHDQLGAWTGYIAVGIAELYFCKVHQNPTVGKGKNRTRRFFVTGNDNYRSAAIAMIGSVISAVYANSKLSSISDRPKGVDGWSFICSFRNAAGARIHARCQELIKEARAGELVNEETGSLLPVLADAYDSAFDAIDAFNADLKLRRASAKRTTSDPFGAAAGRQFGDTIGLRQGIADETSQRLLA